MFLGNTGVQAAVNSRGAFRRAWLDSLDSRRAITLADSEPIGSKVASLAAEQFIERTSGDKYLPEDSRFSGIAWLQPRIWCHEGTSSDGGRRSRPAY